MFFSSDFYESTLIPFYLNKLPTSQCSNHYSHLHSFIRTSSNLLLFSHWALKSEEKKTEKALAPTKNNKKTKNKNDTIRCTWEVQWG